MVATVTFGNADDILNSVIEPLITGGKVPKDVDFTNDIENILGWGATEAGIGMLTEEATQRGLTCLARFAQRLKGFAPWQVRAVATQTLREARNRDAFLQRGNRVLGGRLESCSDDPLTGFYRDGCCSTGPEDVGSHTVCAVMTAEFLRFSKARGNDLSTPVPEYGFPGLRPGDRWCLCASRWKEALDAGMAPKVILEATHISMLEFATIEELREHAVENTDE